METSEQVEKFQEFFDSYKDELQEISTTDERSIQIDFKKLAEYDPELSELLLNDPEDLVKVAELAVGNFDLPLEHLRVRFFNLPSIQNILIRNLRSNHLGKFISVDGIVRQTSDVRPQVVSAKFECPSCGNTLNMIQVDSKFKEPSRCTCGRTGKFRMLSKDLVDAQRTVLEEAPEMLEGGEQPKRIAVFLKEDLVDPGMEKRTTPGSKVKVTGIVKEIAVPLKTGGQSTRFDIIMEANSIIPIESTFEEIKITKKEAKEIEDLAKDPKVYEKLIHSLAPSIYGHKDIKQALILQFMGGVQKVHEDGTKRRGDIHVLLVGDPGSGKSQLLQFASKIAPKARLVSGKGASGAGLTATVVKDEFMRGWALEAGALVLANGGFCIIDEMDKMGVDDTAALHQGLEQQIITISKANVQATLKCQTTLLAAANPKLGRFDPYIPIAAQIELPSTLINRFDLIFPVKDMPSRENDTKIAKHILSLQQKPKELKTEISTDLFKKYIAYAKQKVSPELTDAALKEIEDFYVDLRNRPVAGDEAVKPIPISARQLEALVRMSEGSARVRLGTKVLRKDAQRAINILKHCLMQVGFDYETGQIDIDRISTGVSASERGQIVKVRDLIIELEGKLGKLIPIEDLISEAKEKGISEDKVLESIEKLKRSGDLYEPRRSFISKI